MQSGLKYWWTRTLWTGLLTTGLSMTILGCHGKSQAPSTAEAQPYGTETSSALAARAAAVISAVCTRQSYATARVGLIAGETGLREDVFEFRDPGSYKVVPYRLGATVKLEGLLRQSAGAPARPAVQAECINQFADHLRALTDPLVQMVKDEKDIDVLAFKNAEKEAEQKVETEEQQTEEQH